MRRRQSGPVARHTRATAAVEFDRHALCKVVKQQRQRNAAARKAALEQPVPAAREDCHPSTNTTAREPEKAPSAPEDQPQIRLDSDSYTGPPTTIPDADTDFNIGRGLFQRRSVSSQISSSDEETLTAYYNRIGYLPPLRESTLELIRQLLAHHTMGAGAGRLTTPSEQQSGLVARNVNWYPWPDPYRTAIESLPTPDHDGAIPLLSTDDEKVENKNWDDDLKKCQLDPQEFVFQRTVMMSMLNRHRFIYDQKGVLDFAVERPWTCSPMPTRALFEEDGKTLPMSQPDISVAFRRTAVIDVHYESLPPAMHALICYEGMDAAQQLRAFHFFAIETKSTYKSLRDPVAQFQVLNYASQSLHNMFEFFNEAGPEHLANFFDEVRVFTAVSTTGGIIIRVHRACLTREFREGGPPLPDLPPPKDNILPSYPLQFEYDIYFEAHVNDFKREKVLSTLEKIIINYGAGKLLRLLQNAAVDVVKNFKKARRQYRPKHYYSHQKQPKKPNGKRGSQANSEQTWSTRAHDPSSQASQASISSQDPEPRKLYRENIKRMQTLIKNRHPRTEAVAEDGSPTPTPPTPTQTSVADPTTSLSENFGTGFSFGDSARSHFERPRPGPATEPSEVDTLPPRESFNKRRGVPESDVAGDQPPARSTRSKRSKNQHEPDRSLR